MKVLFTFGGLPHYYNNVLSKLNSVAGLEILVVIPKSKSAVLGKGVYENTEGINFRVIELEEYKTYYRKYFFKDFINLINKERPEIIVVTWPYILAFVFNLKLLIKIKSKKIKLIYKDIPFRLPNFWDSVTFKSKPLPDENLKLQHSFLFKLNTFFLSFIRRILLNIVDAHVNYIEEAYPILGSYGVKKEKIFITYNSPDTIKLFHVKNEISKLNPILPYNPFRIIHVGRLVKWKKVDILIKAFVIIKNKYSTAELIIVGNGPEKNNLEKLVLRLNLQKAVKFVSGVYDNNLLGQYLNASSIYVLAGMGGLSINEAMLFSKPIICSVCDGTEKHLVFDEFNGKYFKEDDENDLAEKIAYILSDPQKINTMGKNSEKIIKDKINIDIVIKGYLNAFNFVTDSKLKLMNI